jgi:hypothetical protein
VAYGVTADGHTTNLWLGLPAGYGIDEQFLAIIAKMRFQPATCHGKPEAAAAGFDVITLSPR